MTEELSFEVYGDTNDMEWSPYEWTDTTDIKDFEKQLIDLAEEQASWGVRLVGKTVQELWEEVLRAKELEDG
jgi:hypothetical protein